MTATKSAPTTADPARNKDLKAIHAMRRELNLADEDYRAIIHRISDGKHSSSADLTAGQRARLCDALRKLGGGKAAVKSRYAAAPQHAKARAIWISLFEAGKIANRSDKALDAFIERQAKQELGALNAQSWRSVIEALKQWATREGVELKP
ncbi:MAG: regulatory protein GemA [Rhodospirillaceae bacterium]